MSKLTEVRQQKGITIESAAGYIGVTADLLEQLEHNPDDLSISEAAMLSELYEVELKTLYE
ncbi:helix-turn-helix domain-containing protein [Virgibacillus siamensis]|uniref:helix-turn-helix domain-containing protein n=1 Tax=Virgibacillus siamensis TaxID=480071 RepID=UPI00362B13CC